LGSIVFYPMSFDKSITIQVGGEQSGYPIENLEDGNWNTTWMNGNDTEAVQIDFDFGTGIKPVWFCIGNHNLTDTGKGIKLSQGDTGVGAAYNELEFLIGNGGYHDYVSANSGLWIETFSAPNSAERYYRLYIEDTTGTKPEIAFISMGTTVFTMNLNYSLGASLGRFYGTEKRITTGGQVKSNQLHGVKEQFQLSFDDIAETDKGFFDAIFTQIQGSLYPFVFTDIDGTNYYVRKQEENNFHDLVEYQIYNKQWTLIEEN